MFISQIAMAQAIKSPVSWSYSIKKTNATEAVITIVANIDTGWHIYSQFVKDNGPLKTSFTFMPEKGYELIGTTTESAPQTRHENVFKMDVGYFEKVAIFEQKIKLKGDLPLSIKCKMSYGPCNDKLCLMPEQEELEIKVK